uniref:Uncharacterized protein n=1 Tax=Rhizophora mucronata TaxID=61149 RepID=A0A2P2JZZ9_RHIMU
MFQIPSISYHLSVSIKFRHVMLCCHFPLCLIFLPRLGCSWELSLTMEYATKMFKGFFKNLSQLLPDKRCQNTAIC